MTIKAGNKVKFADCAAHLKSYDEDAVGKVVIKRFNGTCTVDFENKGRKWTVNCISARNLTRYRGPEYKTVKAQSNDPDKDGWIKWEGGKCPVERGTLVDVKFRDGTKYSGFPANETTDDCDYDASEFFWVNDNQVNDIIAYRLHKPTEDTNDNEQEEITMTTLHDHVAELSTLNERAIELRGLIEAEVEKCGGIVEWVVSPQYYQMNKWTGET